MANWRRTAKMTPRTRRRVAVGLVSLTATLIIAIVLLLIQNLRVERDAKALVQELIRLESGMRLPKPLPIAMAKAVESAECADQKCAYHFSLENWHLSRFGLAPPTLLSARVTTDQGLVVSVSTFLRVHNTSLLESLLGVPTSGMQTDYVAAIIRSREEEGRVRLQRDADGVPYRTIVHTLKRETEAEKGLALRCLTKVGGCSNARELFPVPWVNSEDQRD